MKYFISEIPKFVEKFKVNVIPLNLVKLIIIYHQMNDKEQSGQWIVVTKKHKGINKDNRKKNKSNKGAIIWEMGRPIYVQENQQQDVISFQQSEAYRINSKIISDHLQNYCGKARQSGFSNIVIKIQCIGLGNFIQYLKPRLQFYMLRYMLMSICEKFSSKQIFINCYDPVFTPECIEKVTQIGTFQNTWQQKPKKISQQNKNQIQLTLYFMPHCQRFMYEKICQNFTDITPYKYHEQSQSDKIMPGALVIGNSIREYIERCELIQQRIPQSLLKITKSINYSQKKLKDYRQSLNDTYVYFV